MPQGIGCADEPKKVYRFISQAKVDKKGFKLVTNWTALKGNDKAEILYELRDGTLLKAKQALDYVNKRFL